MSNNSNGHVSIRTLREGPEERYFFDDADLDILQSGDTSVSMATPASIFRNGFDLSPRLMKAAGEPDAFFSIIEEIPDRNTALTGKQCEQIVSLMKRYIPISVREKIKYDRIEITGCLEYIWRIALRRWDTGLIYNCGYYYSRWEEHHMRFEHERKLLSVILSTDSQSFRDKATCTNNIGTAWMLQKQWLEAEPWFEKAIQLYRMAQAGEEVANSYLNLMICRLERIGPLNITDREISDITEAGNYLDSLSDWRARKAFNLLARIYESKRDISRAVFYANKTLLISQKKDTWYISEDEEYNIKLQKLADSVQENP
jgi:tetratricopeptide (TPR) repeat protein